MKLRGTQRGRARWGFATFFPEDLMLRIVGIVFLIGLGVVLLIFFGLLKAIF